MHPAVAARICGMAVITGIVRAKRAKGIEQVEVYLDDDHWVTCPDAVIAEFRLHKGVDVSAAMQTKVEQRVVETELLTACYQAISHRQLTEHQLKEKLLVRGHSEGMIDATL